MCDASSVAVSVLLEGKMSREFSRVVTPAVAGLSALTAAGCSSSGSSMTIQLCPVTRKRTVPLGWPLQYQQYQLSAGRLS
jgi:hypothetical protein